MGKTSFIAMEFIDEKSLAEVFDEHEKLPVKRVVQIGLQLARALDHVVGAMLPAAEARQITLEKELDVTPVIVGDVKRLEQVFSNILSNALKFTPQGGRIELRSRTSGDWVEIEVADSGVGTGVTGADFSTRLCRPSSGKVRPGIFR